MAHDSQFVGSVPEMYQQLMVPMIFAGAADRLADQVAARSPEHILETAAGTGVLTRAIIQRCPAAQITATDLNQPMIDVASATSRGGDRVTWMQSDALDLKFGDETFDVVVCQFGAMFFPDKVRGYAEASRVLRPGGAFVFNVWDRIEANEVPQTIEQALLRACPNPPLLFMSRTPHGYHDVNRIRAELGEAGFSDVDIQAVDAVSRTTAADAAVAYCQGTPLRGEIAAHPGLDVPSATQIALDALVARYGSGPIAAPIRSFEVVAS
ncbi:MAG: methyltransferase domain-containing protein [Aeromicrobium sp.]|uniref:class I SAM-dependent methyltransferase n=1 Tax=Aeromicrobium sp. TaxID=1871063 RepID=UPI003C3C76D9